MHLEKTQHDAPSASPATAPALEGIPQPQIDVHLLGVGNRR